MLQISRYQFILAAAAAVAAVHYSNYAKMKAAEIIS